MKKTKFLLSMLSTMVVGASMAQEEADGQVGTYMQTMDSVTKPTPLDGHTNEKGFDSGLYYLFFSASGASSNGSTLDYTYEGGGCMSQNNSILNGDLDVNLQLPDGHSIRGYRYYWYDTSASSSAASLFQMDGQGGFTLIDSYDSTGDTGYGSFYSNLTDGDHVVNNTNGAYVIRFNSNENGSGQRMCGVRIAMVAP